MPIKQCEKCKVDFYAKPSWLKRGWGKYCSSSCQHEASRTGKYVNCSYCNKEIYKSPKALKGSKSGKFFCGKSCQTKWRNREFSQEKHPNWKSGNHSYRSLLSRGKTPKKCKLCNSGDTRVLAVHHIDENHSNNSIENLAWLCHNCHHLVHHYSKEKERFMATIV
ncbi:HNH endonuclease [Candidatus Kaiserbacteria bacterium]|nr:HNH endonuclease [Candidatus Kaiserbacteria bacterium]USN92651.1 MAG: HNH endonuclease [Candidatus Nomurabacteria bacterium]